MTIAATIFTIAALSVVAFQVALALGAPWGHLAMGGKYSGVFPPTMRASAILQAAILIFLSWVVLRHSGVLEGGAPLSRNWLIWVAVGFSAISTVLNAVTPSKAERRIWLPVAALMLVSSVYVSFAPQAAP